MLKIQEATNQEKPGTFKKFIPLAIDDKIYHLAFLNSLQATIITTVSSEKILIDNKASVNSGLFRNINENFKAYDTDNIIF